jgi:hypothetical protein
VVIALIALAWFILRRRKTKRRASAGGVGYAAGHDASANDLQSEKERGVVSAAPTAGGIAAASVARSHSDSFHRDPAGAGSFVSGRDSALGASGARSPTPPLGAGGIPRKPLGGAAAGSPVDSTGPPVASAVLSEEERLRWEEEERRLDEDIAEAERRRREEDGV